VSPASGSVNPERVTLHVTNDGGYTFSTDVMSYFYQGRTASESAGVGWGGQRERESERVGERARGRLCVCVCVTD
jgi:hypothetical protein